ncbi:MAG TPA: hypothetical protein VGP25_08305 [Gemmatimonadaceae bacterium]|nr:hypothetical protein [Gemmatimonadaceae bacterium]
MLKRPVWRVVAVLLALVLCVLGLEGLSSFGLLAHDIRNIPPAPKNFRQATYDTLLGWVGLPNLAMADNYGPGLRLTTNADGMRIHRPTTAALAPGEKRVICSGDSFTFGSGVSDDETFCAYLEQELPGVRTLNMAQRGYGIDQAYLWYKRDAVRYPHQLHVFAFIWADFERMAVTTFTGYPKSRLRLKNGALALENVPVPQWKGESKSATALGMLPDLRLVQLIERQTDQSETAKLARVDAQVWDIAMAVFKDLARLNKERGSNLVLVYLPAPNDLAPGAQDRRRQWLAEFSRTSGIPFVDLTDEIRRVPPDSADWMFITPNALPVQGSSGHYTAAGHRWVAARLAEHLRAMPAVAASLAVSTR